MHIHIFMKTPPLEKKDLAAKPKSFPCLCAAVRKTGRVLTRKYEAYLKPSGLKVTQFSMLATISRHPGISVSDLAGLLVMDQTTVTRNLGVLERSGYVRLEPRPDDQRVRQVALTDTGRVKVKEARPLWDRAQEEVEGLLGREDIDSLLQYLRRLNG